eukprot:scaffold518_cov388-Prasinococcus_capsulatus_cf.AAC.17
MALCDGCALPVGVFLLGPSGAQLVPAEGGHGQAAGGGTVHRGHPQDQVKSQEGPIHPSLRHAGAAITRQALPDSELLYHSKALGAPTVTRWGGGAGPLSSPGSCGGK